MRKFLSLLIFSTLFLPSTALAFQSIAEEEKLVTQLESKEDDIYAVGGSLTIQTDIPGDLVIAGGELEIVNNVETDLMAAGGSIVVKGNVGDDARIAGGQIDIYGNIGGDLLITGGQITIHEGAIIGNDVGIGGGQVTILGQVQGDAEIYAGQISMGESAQVAGNLTYGADHEISEVQKSVAGTVTYEQFDTEVAEAMYSPAAKMSHLLIKIIQLAALTALFYLLYHRFFEDSLKMLQKKVGFSYLWGSVAVLAGWIPVIFIMFVSIALGLWWLGTWLVFFIFLYKLFLSIFATTYLVQKYKVKTTGKTVGMILAASAGIKIFYGILSMIPGAFILKMLIFLGAFLPLVGAMIMTKAKVCSLYLKGKLKVH